MSRSANVRSVAAIHDFKVAMANFAEDAMTALSGSEMEVRRIRNWLQRDQLSYWQMQVKRRTEEVSTARTELHRRRLSQQGSDAVSDTEQKENLRVAQRRLDEAERKVAIVKKWVPILEHAIAEYHSAVQPLGDRLTGAFVNSMALLERTVAAVEAYAAVAPPPAPVLPEPGAAASGPVSTASFASAAAPGGAAEAPASAEPPADTAVPAATAASDPATVEPGGPPP
jgi:hypothetical protein